MKSWLVVLTLVLIPLVIGSIWLLRPEKTSESAFTASRRPNPGLESPRPLLPTSELGKASRSRPEDSNVTGEDPLQPTERVAFVVEDGFAVAQGDILLGTPDDPTVQAGFSTLQAPVYWESPDIPFVIDSGVVKPERITQAIEHIQEKTGLRFVPFHGQRDAILFKRGELNCISPLGRQGGLQPIRLDSKCGWREVVHEILHSLGFIHEQSRVDRDQYVEVLWKNVDPAFKDQFQILSFDFLGPARGTAFDYESIMLYDDKIFAKVRGQITLRSKSPTPISPSKEGLSKSDILRIRSFFRLD